MRAGRTASTLDRTGDAQVRGLLRVLNASWPGPVELRGPLPRMSTIRLMSVPGEPVQPEFTVTAPASFHAVVEIEITLIGSRP